MYVGSSSHGDKIYHGTECSYVRRIKKKNRIFFETEEGAREQGYRKCNCCSYMSTIYKQELEELTRLSRQNHFKFWYYDDAIYIQTLIATWKIIASKKKHSLLLFHSCNEVYKNCDKKNGKLIHRYHIQNDVRKKSVSEYTDYIVKHDIWREKVIFEYKNLPKRTNRQKKEYKKIEQKMKKQAVRNVCNIIEQLQLEQQ